MSFIQKIINFFSGTKREIKPVESITPIPEKTFEVSYPTNILSAKELFICNLFLHAKEDAIFLKEITKKPVEELFFACTDNKECHGLISATTEERARECLQQHQQTFIDKNKYLFISELSSNGYNLSIIPNINDGYTLIEKIKTNGAKLQISTNDIIIKLKKWDAEFGIQIIGVGIDYCEAAIHNLEIDYNALANEVYQFCPDVVEQGTETIEALAEEMQTKKSIFLWWDN